MSEPKPALTFEVLRTLLDALPIPARAGDRSTHWAFSRLLGVARTSDDAFELFMVGPRLHPRSATVRRHLEHGTWSVAGSEDTLEANRIVLPPAPHFVAIAALIAIELARAGIGTDRRLQDVFDDVEPIVDLALRRGALGEEHLTGLVGELLCLEEMLDAVVNRVELRSTVLDMWRGHAIGRRDFLIGAASVEVKTTHQESSSHKISGLHQVEPDPTAETAEQELFLLSVGLAATEQEGQTLPQVVNRVLDRLREHGLPPGTLSPLQARFLDDVANYGSGSARGYDHRTMEDWQVYQGRFRLTFTPRLYDMSDDAIRVLRRRDVEGTHVSPDDIQYRMDLPTTVSGWNPAPSWQHAVHRMVRDALSMDTDR